MCVCVDRYILIMTIESRHFLSIYLKMKLLEAAAEKTRTSLSPLYFQTRKRGASYLFKNSLGMAESDRGSIGDLYEEGL